MKQTAFRILALTLALLLASSALMACQADASVNTNNTDETTANTTTQDTTVATDPVPETDPPATTPPETNPPETNPPVTNPPVTNPPETDPPVTNPPETDPPETDPPETTPPPEDKPSNPTVSDDGNVVEYLYPEELVEALNQNIQSNPGYFTAFYGGNAPYMIQDEEFLSNGTVHSIAFPVSKTLKADHNGDFCLTASVFGKDLSTGLKAAALRTYTIKINRDEYKLKENDTLLQWISIDVSDLKITIGENEALAFFSPNDTLVPAYSKNTSIKNLIDTHTNTGTGFLSSLGTESIGFSCDTLLFNIGVERNYTPESDTYQAILAERSAYMNMLQTLAEKYQGKTLSVFGDSISTWQGISNSTDYNVTIGNNAVYYPSNGSMVSDVAHTYWMQVIDTLGMKLCVNNSWSGGRVFGKSGESYLDSAVTRATQLHDDNGTPNDPTDDTAPDVILFYMGINDINNNVAFGDLMEQLASEATHEDKLDKIDEWFFDLYLRTNQLENRKGGTDYKTFQEAYAIALYLMHETYPDAEIYCLNLLPCVKYFNNNGNKLDTMESYNEFIGLIAEYFELTVVDQYHESHMNFDTNMQFYTNASDLLHPNAAGHTKMAELILDTISRKNKLK